VAFDYERAELKQAQTKVNQIEKAYGEKIEECYSKINSLKRQLEAMSREIDTDKQQIAELEDKYTEKSRQKRKLEELYDALKSKCESVGVSGAISSFVHRPSAPAAGYPPPDEAPSKFQRFSKFSPSIPPRNSSPHNLQKTSDVDRFLFRKSPARMGEKTTRSPGPPPSTPAFTSPKGSIFRTVKIPESPRFPRFGNRD